MIDEAAVVELRQEVGSALQWVLGLEVHAHVNVTKFDRRLSSLGKPCSSCVKAGVGYPICSCSRSTHVRGCWNVQVRTLLRRLNWQLYEFYLAA